MLPRVTMYRLPDSVVWLSQLFGNVDHSVFWEEATSHSNILIGQLCPVISFTGVVMDSMKRSGNVFKILWAVVKATFIDVVYLKSIGSRPNESTGDEFVSVIFLADVLSEQPEVMVTVSDTQSLNASMMSLDVSVFGSDLLTKASYPADAANFVESFVSGDCAPIFLRGILIHVESFLVGFVQAAGRFQRRCGTSRLFYSSNYTMLDEIGAN